MNTIVCHPAVSGMRFTYINYQKLCNVGEFCYKLKGKMTSFLEFTHLPQTKNQIAVQIDGILCISQK